MREIKFRAWDKEANTYVEIRFDFLRIDGNGSIYRRAWGETVWDRTTNLIIEQFAELKNKNSTDLDWWEGDIFARSSDGQIEGSVIYDLGCFWLDRIRGGRTPLYECVDWSMYKIGNIHQNQELLEQDNV